MCAGSRDLAGTRHSALGRDLDFGDQPRARGSSPSLFGIDEALDDTVFDIRGQKTQRARRLDFADDFANDVAASTQRLRARITTSTEKFEDKARQAFDDAEASFRRHVASPIKEPATPSEPMARWTKLSSGTGEESSAASRAKITKALLSDLESEMEEL